MASIDVAKLLNKITQDIPGINTVLKALAKWDVSALTDVPDGAMQATTDANNNLTIKKKVSGSYTPVAKLMHDVDKLDGYHASASATANAVAVRNAQGALPGNILGNSATADTATALATGSVVPVNQGGTGATTASQARANLGVADGADFTTHIAKQSSPTVEGHVKLDALAADGSNMAAPGGYGLGKTVGRITGTTLNNLLEGGFYSLVSSPNTAITDVAFPNIGNGTMLVIPRGNETIQLFFCSLGWVYRRYAQPTATWGDFINIPNGITDSTSTASSTIAASAAAVKTAYDRAKQVATASISGGVKVGGAISSVSSDGTVTLSSATTTARGIGRVATAADVAVGSTITNGPAFLDAATWKASADPETSGIIPLTGDGGKIHLKLIGTMLCNVRTVITTSGTFTYPVSGWYRKIVIAAGGAGGSGSMSNASIAGGGGGAGQVKTAFEWHNANTSESVIIGAGGTPGAIGAAGSNGGNTTFGGVVAIGGKGGKCSLTLQACSAGGRGYGSGGPGGGQYITGGGVGIPGTGGVGGSNGTDYGGGGGGGTVWANGVSGVGGIGTANGLDGSYGASDGSAGAGGKGGDGAVIIEYFNPAVTA